MPVLVHCHYPAPFREAWADLARSGGIGDVGCAVGALESLAIMKFIIAIEPGTESTAWGVAVPDLPGCFSAGHTMDEAMENARQAIDQHVEIMIEDGAPIPVARPLAAHQANPEYAGWVCPVEWYPGQAG